MAAVAGSRSHPNGGGPLSAPASVLDGASTPSGSPSPASPAPEVARHIRAVLDFDAPCWVRAVSDGRTIVERTIAAGQRLVVRGDRRVDLVLGNAGGVTLEVNGEAVRTGSSGDVTTLSLRLRDGAVVTR
jgi:hypothetical protein